MYTHTVYRVFFEGVKLEANYEIFTHETVPHSTVVWFSVPRPLAKNSLLTKILPPKNTRYTVRFRDVILLLRAQAVSVSPYAHAQISYDFDPDILRMSTAR